MKKIQQFENGSGRAKTILELKLVKDVNGNKKTCFKYIRSRRNARENVSPLIVG